ncbi:hypothetical protein G7Y79_00032g067210 [Physcia stellaris]|nr:hypothetical protein G7Y79_00032g067210 [Physcia stellaris]
MLSFLPRFAIFVSFVISIIHVAASNVEYIIYPKEDLPLRLVSDLASLIERLGGGKNRIYASTRPNREMIEYWVVTLNEQGVELLRNTPSVDFILPNRQLVEPFVDYTAQYMAPQELVALSQPPGWSPGDISHWENYVYRSRTDLHKESFVYHAEIGINQDHEDFRHRRIHWLYTGYARKTGNAVPTESRFSSRPGHSTCTASKAVGNVNGASKFATLVVVKMPDLSLASIGEVFSTIADDMKFYRRTRKSVVTVSWGSRTPIDEMSPTEGQFWNKIKRHLQELTDADVPCIFAAGDAAEKPASRGRQGKRTFVDTLPAAWVSSGMRALIASSTNNNGERWKNSQYDTYNPRSQGKGFNIFAPGVNVQCASYDSRWAYQNRTGTSFSAPLAAGMVADMMGHDEIREDWTPEHIASYIRGWKRNGGEYVIWNHCEKPWTPPPPYLLNIVDGREGNRTNNASSDMF